MLNQLKPGEPTDSFDNAPSLQRFLLKLGRLQTVMLITLVTSVLVTLLTMMTSTYVYDHIRLIDIQINVFITLVAAPLICTYFINLMFELDKARKALAYLANRDPLTQTHNRRYFMDIAKIEFDKSVRHQLPLSLIMLDVDNFKQVNDQYGHIHGDLVLRNLSDAIQPRLRNHDLMARYGGEEFAIVLPHTEASAAHFVAARLCEMVPSLQIQNSSGETIKISISVGVATLQPYMNDLNHLIDAADQALYRAKRAGKNRVAVASEELPNLDSALAQ